MSLAYRVDGQETQAALVLANSLGTTWELWDAQLPALADFMVVRFDHPGHGLSAEPDAPVTVETIAREVVAILDELEVERASFCGISLGGMVGMALALTAPDRVDRLVLCCTTAYLGPPESWHERAAIVRAAGTAAVAERVLDRWFGERFRLENPGTTARFRSLLEATTTEGYAACCEALAAWDARADVHAITSPTLVIAGAEDVAAPPEDGAFLAETIPNATLTVLADAAHLANVEQPEAFDAALLAHLTPAAAREAP